MESSADDWTATDARRYLKVLTHGGSFGSGYLLAPGLALTAAHVIAGAEAIEVRSTDSEWAAARILWSGGPDIALLAVDASASPPAVALGRIATATAVEFSAVGFPLAQASSTREGELRDSEQVLGFLSPQTHLETGVLALHARTGAPQRLPDGRSPWAGMSGAAVICEGCVVGVVVHDPAAFGEDRLVAQPATVLWDQPTPAQRLAAAGIAAVDVAPGSAPAPPPESPGEHVAGERITTAIETFTDRSELRAVLRRILINGEADLIAVFGRRGIGKTGLVGKVMADLEAELDGVCYLSSRTGSNRLDLGRILSAAARLLPSAQRQLAEGVIASAGHTPAEQTSYLLHALADRRWVVVLDDIDPLLDPAGGLGDPDLLTFLQAVVRAERPPTVILTSRVAPLLPPGLLGARIAPVELADGIPPVDGAQLLLRWDALGQARMADLTAAQREQLVAAVQGVPRAMELLVGVRARNLLLPPDQLLAKLLATQQALDELVSVTYQELPPDQLAAVRIASVFAVPIDAAALIALCRQREPGDYDEAINALVVTRVFGLDPGTTRVRLHPLDAEAVVAGLPEGGPWSLPAISAAVADWYQAQAPGGATWRTRAELQAPLAEARHRIRAGNTGRALELALELARRAPRAGEGAAVLALLAKLGPSLDAPREQATHALASAWVRHLIGPNEAAIGLAAQARDAFAALGDRRLEAEALSIWGDSLRYAGSHEEAVRRNGDALQVAPDMPVAERSLLTLRLGLAQLYAGRLADAEATAARMDALDPEGGSMAVQAMRLDLLSLARLLGGHPSEALALARQGAQTYAHSDLEPENACYVVNVAGLAQMQLGELSAARDSFRTGLTMAQEARLPRAEGSNAYNLTWVEVLTGRVADSGMAAERAAQGFLEDGGQETVVARALERCLAAIRHGEADEALAALGQITDAAALNPELYRPSSDALGAIRALILAAAEAASSRPQSSR